jgi:hypothetical protein
MVDLPLTLQINAFADVSNVAQFESAFKKRLLSGGLALDDLTMLAPPPPADERNWLDQRVGWGIVLPDDPALDTVARAKADDAPEPLRALLAKRQGVVLRYAADRPLGTIRRYYDDGSAQQDVFVAASNFGTSRGKVPRYLLICSDPSVIPWSLQFELQQTCYTGRLALEGDALARYVVGALVDWNDDESEWLHSLIWTVDLNPNDITHLMGDSIARPMAARIQNDAEFAPGLRMIDGLNTDASGTALRQGLADHKPRFIATTSHGATGPLNDVAAMRARLGLLVDASSTAIDPAAMLQDWQPAGAIWYAHACCSAGSLGQTAFADLVTAGSDVWRILTGVAACGDTVAPLPQALLGANRPLRAFIGHVEPTFDWSLRHPRTNQFLTLPLLKALYDGLFAGQPVGMALDSCRQLASGLLNVAYAQDKRALANAAIDPGAILAVKLMANDWRSMVVLGDPAAKAMH